MMICDTKILLWVKLRPKMNEKISRRNSTSKIIAMDHKLYSVPIGRMHSAHDSRITSRYASLPLSTHILCIPNRQIQHSNLSGLNHLLARRADVICLYVSINLASTVDTSVLTGRLGRLDQRVELASLSCHFVRGWPCLLPKSSTWKLASSM